MVALIFLIVAVILCIFLTLKWEPPQVNIRWIVAACLIGAVIAGMPLPRV